MKAPTFAPAYVAFYPMLCEIAREKGYALAIHGTVTRDLDILAFPWVEDAAPVDSLVMAIADYATTCLKAMFSNSVTITGPEAKPHGRIAYSILVGNGAVIDLSIAPRSAPTSAPLGLAIEQEPKYTTDGHSIINRATGEAIPGDEPIFIFRARDRVAAGMLGDYAMHCTNPDQVEAVNERFIQFSEWADANPGRMKEPDTGSAS